MEPRNQPPFEPAVLARTASIVVLCLALVALNLYTLWRVVRLERMADRPVSVSCRGSTIPVEALRGIVYQDARVGPELLPDGAVEAQLSFELFEKEPGSVVAVLYRTLPDGPWLETTCTAIAPLVFEARIAVGARDRLEWQAIETVRGEVVRASQLLAFEVAHAAGSPAVRFSYSKQQGASTIEYFFRQEGVPSIVAWQVEQIVLNVTRKGKTEEVQLTQPEPGWPTFTCRIQDADLELVEVVVRYRDGVERRAEIRPPYNVPDPVVTR